MDAVAGRFRGLAAGVRAGWHCRGMLRGRGAAATAIAGMRWVRACMCGMLVAGPVVARGTVAGAWVDGKRRRPLAVGVRLWACRCQGSLQGALVVKAIRTPAAVSLRRYACRAAVAGVWRWRVVPAVGLYWCYLRDAGGQRRPPVAAAPRRGMSVAGRCWGLALAGCAGSGFVLVLPKGCWRSKAAPGGSSPRRGMSVAGRCRGLLPALPKGRWW